MRKNKVLLLALLLTLGMLAGCGKDATKDKEMEKEPSSSVEGNDWEMKPSNSDTNEPNEPIEPDKAKLEQDVIASSVISEGFAVVSCNKSSYTCYGIEMDGTIAFELALSENFNVSMLDRCEFVNGLMLIDGGFCDTSGNMTYPDDVGVSNFYNHALEEGYIFADVITSGFDGTVSQMGIMDTSFHWVVEPNEALYSSLYSQWGLVFTRSTGRHDGFYCHDGCLYSEDVDVFIELETGRTISGKDGPQEQPSYSWKHSRKKYYNRNETDMVDLSAYDNTHYLSKYNNGVAGVVFYNADAKQHFLTVIDEKGSFLFEPIAFNEQGSGSGNVWVMTDGNIIVAYEAYNSVDGMVRTYDMDGNLLGELDAEELTDNAVFVEIEEGVVVFRMVTTYGQMDTWFFTPDFTTLY